MGGILICYVLMVGLGIPFDISKWNPFLKANTIIVGIGSGLYYYLLRKYLKTMTDFSMRYDTVFNQFIADRYVEGNCPVCNNLTSVGWCECGKENKVDELINPISLLSGTTPILKEDVE